MAKIAVYLLIGLGAGFAVATLSGSGDSDGYPAGQAAGAGAALEQRLAELETALADERRARRRLETSVAVLLNGDGSTANIALPGDPDALLTDGLDANDDGLPGVAETVEFGPHRDQAFDFQDRLVEAGLSPDRSEYIVSRSEALRLEALQARYESARARAPGGARNRPDLNSTLRAELGDADFEKYLQAIGRPTEVPVGAVLANSPAARAGFVPGDRIIGYDGQRIFDMNELTSLTLAGASGESVAVDVIRNGQTIQLYLPRGPLGISGGRRFSRDR